MTNSAPAVDELRLAVVIGPLLAPRHGAAVSNLAAVAALAAEGWQVHSIDTSPGTLTRSAGYYVRRLSRFAASVTSALKLRRQGPASCPADSAAVPGWCSMHCSSVSWQRVNQVDACFIITT